MPTDHISSFVFQHPTSLMPISTLQKKVSGKVSTTLMLSVRGHVSPHKPSLFPPPPPPCSKWTARPDKGCVRRKAQETRGRQLSPRAIGTRESYLSILRQLISCIIALMVVYFVCEAFIFVSEAAQPERK